jgi:hypothetical protein
MMSMQIFPNPVFLTRTKPQSVVKRECLEPFPFQEQFTGPLPLRLERPAAEILAERLAESCPDSTPPVFIP